MSNAPWLSVSRTPDGWAADGTATWRDQEGGGWSYNNGQLDFITDGLGFRPYFYFSTPERFAIAASLPALLRVTGETALDHEAIEVFVRLGFMVGDDTPFARLRRAPATGLTWRSGQLTLGPRPAIPAQVRESRDEAIDRYIALFAQAISRVPDDVEALPLSGGKDSRHTLLELVRQGRAPRTAVTVARMPRAFDADVEAARVLARRYGLRHVVLRSQPLTPRAEREKNTLTDFASDEHRWLLPVARYLRSSGVRGPVFDGIGGDNFTAGHFFSRDDMRFLRSGDLGRVVEAFMFAEDTARLAGSRGGSARDDAIGRAAAELEYHLASANPLSEFLFWNRTRNEISQSPYGLLARSVHDNPIRCPYIDKDLLTFLRGLPVEMIDDHRLHVDTIARAFPEARGIPYASDLHHPLGWRWAKLVHNARTVQVSAHALPQRRELMRAAVRQGRRAEKAIVLTLWMQQVRAIASGDALPDAS